jgi:peptidoglycan/LPS O-acetylase OafA/YrhL
MTSLPRQYPALDLLRLVAIGMTMLVHTPSISGHLPLLRNIQGGLFLGVDLFMLISGWLLGGQLIRERQTGNWDVRRFYFKRWMRTLPPYYAVLTLLWTLGQVRFFPRFEYAGSHFAFLQEYLGTQRFGVSWSLCVEEHFYLLLPWVVPLLVRRGTPRKLALGLLALSLFQVGTRLAVFHPGMDVPTITHLRSEGLFIGLGMAYLARCAPDLWGKLTRYSIQGFLIGGLLTLLTMLSAHWGPGWWLYAFLPTLGTWTLALAFPAFIAPSSPLSRLQFRGLPYLGELTYSIYLTHTLVTPLLANFHTVTGAWGLAARFLLMAATSVSLHHLVERPSMKIRRWWLSSRFK